MACEGGECKVQIFDVRVDGVKVEATELDYYAGGKKNHPDKSECLTPTAGQIANIFRKKPVWLTKCPHPDAHGAETCQCIFITDDLDAARGWTPWVKRDPPNSYIEIEGTDGPDKPQSSTCKYWLRGNYFESSKIIHGVCMEPGDESVTAAMKKALEQRNPAPPPA